MSNKVYSQCMWCNKICESEVEEKISVTAYKGAEIPFSVICLECLKKVRDSCRKVTSEKGSGMM